MHDDRTSKGRIQVGVWPTKAAVSSLAPPDLVPLVQWIELGTMDTANGCAGILTAGNDDSSTAAGRNDAVVWPAGVPVLQVTRLTEPASRDAFFERVLGHASLADLFTPDWTIAQLVAFNIRERYRVLVHDPKQHRLMGRLIAKPKDHTRAEIEAEIRGHYLDALAKPVTARKHANLFAHVLELLEDRIDDAARDEIDQAVAEFTAGRTTLLVPVDRLAKEVTRLRIAGLEAQSYLYPGTLERALRFGPL